MAEPGAKFKRPEGHKCHISTGIHGGLTFGNGELDEHGFWEKPCHECARAWEQRFPEDGACWPFSEKYLREHFYVTEVQPNK